MLEAQRTSQLNSEVSTKLQKIGEIGHEQNKTKTCARSLKACTRIKDYQSNLGRMKDKEYLLVQGVIIRICRCRAGMTACNFHEDCVVS